MSRPEGPAPIPALPRREPAPGERPLALAVGGGVCATGRDQRGEVVALAGRVTGLTASKVWFVLRDGRPALAARCRCFALPTEGD